MNPPRQNDTTPTAVVKWRFVINKDEDDPVEEVVGK